MNKENFIESLRKDLSELELKKYSIENQLSYLNGQIEECIRIRKLALQDLMPEEE